MFSSHFMLFPTFLEFFIFFRGGGGGGGGVKKIKISFHVCKVNKAKQGYRYESPGREGRWC